MKKARLSWIWLGLTAVAITVSLRLGRDYDFWYHIKTGELIWSLHAIPKTDVFSFVAQGRLWILHEWLWQVLTYLLYSRGGIFAITLFQISLSAILATLVYRTLKVASQGNQWLLAWGSGVAGIVLTLGFRFRPQIISFIFLAYITNLILKNNLFKRWKPLILIFWLWSNLHAGFIWGLGLVGLYTIRTIFQTKKFTRPLAAFAGMTGICLLTPLFSKAFFYSQNINLFKLSLFNNEYVNSLTLLQLTYVQVFYFLLTLAITVWVLSLREQNTIDWFSLAIVAVFGYAGFRFVRAVPLAALTILPFCSRQLATMWKGTKFPMGIFGKTLVSALLIFFLLQNLFSLKPSDPPPTALAHFARESDLQGNMYNHYNWGGPLIYYLYPTYQVYIDGRNDVYSLAEYMEFVHLKNKTAGWQAIADKYQFDWAIVNNEELKNGLGKGLFYDLKWALVYWDKQGAILVARNEKNMSVINRFEITSVQPFAPMAVQENAIDEGIAQYKKLLTEDPTNHIAIMGLGNTYFYVQHNPQKAIVEYESLVPYRKTDAELLMNLGLAYFELKRYDEAVGSFQKVIKLEPNNWHAYKNLGVVYLDYLKKNDKGKENLRRYLDLVEGTSFDTEEADGIREKLDRTAL